jgi:hypothetical protein
MKTCLALRCPPPSTGSRRSHCAGCHHTFSGLSAFDRHQTLNGGNICHAPDARGLIRRPDGVWRLPGEMPNGVFPPSGVSENGLAGASVGTEAHGEAGEAQEGSA